MAMTSGRMGEFRRVLEAMDGRVRDDLQSLEEQAPGGLGGEAGGNLSSAPMHLADFGTEQDMQELNATLFENEEYIRLEVQGRWDGSTAGRSASASAAAGRSSRSGSRSCPILATARLVRPRWPTVPRST